MSLCHFEETPDLSITTVLTPSFRNCLFENHPFLKHLQQFMIMSSFGTPNVLKIAIQLKIVFSFSDKILSPKSFYIGKICMYMGGNPNTFKTQFAASLPGVA